MSKSKKFQAKTQKYKQCYGGGVYPYKERFEPLRKKFKSLFLKMGKPTKGENGKYQKPNPFLHLPKNFAVTSIRPEHDDVMDTLALRDRLLHHWDRAGGSDLTVTAFAQVGEGQRVIYSSNGEVVKAIPLNKYRDEVDRFLLEKELTRTEVRFTITPDQEKYFSTRRLHEAK